jgi:signal transduction histidine kinase/ligand-binding sensor domain-containing protein
VNLAAIPIALALLGMALRMFAADDGARTNASFNVRVWETEHGLPQSSILALAQTPDGYLWLGTLNGLVRFDGLRFEVFDTGNTPALDDSPVVTLFIASDGALWIGSEANGIARLNHGEFTREEKPPADFKLPRAPWDVVAAFWKSNSLNNVFEEYPWGRRRVKAACDDKNGNLIVGTDGAGVFWLYQDGTVVPLNTGNGLSQNFIRSLLVDREGTLWIGTDGGGLNRVTRQDFNVVPETRGWTIHSVSADESGALWIGTGANGLVSWKDGVLRDHFYFPGIGWKVVLATRDRIWLGANGVYHFKDGRFHTPIEITQDPRVMYEATDGAVWFGTDAALTRFDGTNWQAFTTKDGLTSGAITAVREHRDSTLWIGTRRGGINLLRGGKFTAIRKSDGAPGDDIAALWIDAEGVVWVTTPGSGLGRFREGRWTHYTTREGLVSNSLGYILDDERGNLWIGSTIGLLRVPKSVLDDYADGKVSAVQCRAYGKADGLPTAECSPAVQPGPLRARDGTLWFPTIKGLAFVNPAQITWNMHPPRVVIQSVVVDNKPRAISNGTQQTSVTLTPRDNRLEIHYASLNLAAPERALSRYRLEGLEKDWIDAGNSRLASYNKLPPGNYTFHVIAANEDGVWNEGGRTLVIVVRPPFWRTWWFITLVTLGMIGIIAGSVHYFSTQRLQRQLAVLRQQEALERERARIARDIHDQVGASLTQVALLGELVETDKESPADIEEHAKQISQTARETTRALDEIVWTVNPQNDTLEGLVNYICKYAQDYLAVADVKYRFDVPAQLPPTSIAPDVRHNVFLAAKEGVTNIVRHAKATAASVRMHLRDEVFCIEIEDNGRGLGGMDPQRAKTRHGLSNMRKRMEDIGGEFVLEPGRDGGAVVRLTVPLKKKGSA